MAQLKSGLWDGLRYAIDQSTLPGLVICVILILVSSFSWTVMITKLLTVWKTRRNTKKFLELFRAAKNPLALYQGKVSPKACPVKYVYDAACGEVCFHVVGSTTKNDTFESRLQGAGKIAPSQMKAVENCMERAVGECASKLEGLMTMLASAVSGAPFLGLLGTVWGVMDTFGSVAMAGEGTTLAAMAPGVSAALLTTVTGLLVAIPAMFGYNFLASAIKGLVVELDNFSAELGGAMNRSYVEHGRRFESLPSMTAMGEADHGSLGKTQPSLAMNEERSMEGVVEKKKAGSDDKKASEKVPPATPSLAKPEPPSVKKTAALVTGGLAASAAAAAAVVPSIDKVIVGEDNSRISDEEWAERMRMGSEDVEKDLVTETEEAVSEDEGASEVVGTEPLEAVEEAESPEVGELEEVESDLAEEVASEENLIEEEAVEEAVEEDDAAKAVKETEKILVSAADVAAPESEEIETTETTETSQSDEPVIEDPAAVVAPVEEEEVVLAEEQEAVVSPLATEEGSDGGVEEEVVEKGESYLQPQRPPVVKLSETPTPPKVVPSLSSNLVNSEKVEEGKELDAEDEMVLGREDQKKIEVAAPEEEEVLEEELPKTPEVPAGSAVPEPPVVLQPVESPPRPRPPVIRLVPEIRSGEDGGDHS